MIRTIIRFQRRTATKSTLWMCKNGKPWMSCCANWNHHYVARGNRMNSTQKQWSIETEAFLTLVLLFLTLIFILVCFCWSCLEMCLQTARLSSRSETNYTNHIFISQSLLQLMCALTILFPLFHKDNMCGVNYNKCCHAWHG